VIEQEWIEEGAAASEMNLGEVLYIRARSHGETAASEDVGLIRRRLTVVPASWDLIVRAARIKARGGLSFADALCLATAQELNADLWTGDPEILHVAAATGCPARDLRSAE